MNPIRLACLAATVAFALPLTAAQNSGVRMDDTIQAGGEDLVLNGTALRKKAMFKVYVAGLYLPAKESDPAAILNTDSVRSLAMEFVRKVGAGSLAGAWNDCLQANTPDASAETKREFARLGGWMQDMVSGDRIVFTYSPGTGTHVKVKDRDRGPVAGKAFADALFRCWIGDHPPSQDFKDGLLGGG